MAYKIPIPGSTESIQFPQKCPCCGEHADTEHGVKHDVSISSIILAALCWDIPDANVFARDNSCLSGSYRVPYCKRCVHHMKIATFVKVPLYYAIWGVAMQAVEYLEDMILPATRTDLLHILCILALLVLPLLVAERIASCINARDHLFRSKDCCVSKPITFDKHSFTLATKTYAGEFVAANSALGLIAQPTGTKGVSGSMQGRSQIGEALAAGFLGGAVAGLAAHYLAGGRMTFPIFIVVYILELSQVKAGRLLSTIVFVAITSGVTVLLDYLPK